MKVVKILSVAIVSALLAACSSDSNNVRPDAPPPSTTDPAEKPRPSEGLIDERYRSTINQEKNRSLKYDTTNGYSYEITLRNGTDTYTETYNFFTELPNGLSDLAIIQTHEKTDNKDNELPTTYSGTLLVYQQPYSVITGVTWIDGSGPEYNADNLRLFHDRGSFGFSTPVPALSALVAQKEIFNYTGVAFDRAQPATLNYTMDFGKREGQGSITTLDRTGPIDLKAAQLNSDWVIKGDARLVDISASQQDAKYELYFYGPRAEEVVGKVYDTSIHDSLDNSDIIFAGEKR